MNRRKFELLAGVASVLAGIMGSTAGIAAGTSPELQQARALFKPLPADMGTPEFPITQEKVTLGRALFFDPRPSLDGTVSCAHCHQPALYGTDALPLPIGVKDRVNPRNAPTVLNAAQEFVAHWRGDRLNVEDQATKALIGPPSFGQPDLATAMAKVEAIPGYQAMFKQAFPNDKNPINAENWGKAIGAYERTLVTPSPFDAYLKGDVKALSPAAVSGMQKFINTGCAACHSGAGVGGGMYQKFGLVEDYWKETGSKKIDTGRFDVTKNPADMYVFKVPSLRNVAMTAPYFHDGSVATLPEAVRVMGQVQLGKKLDSKDIEEIVAFLNSLTGKLPANFATAPTLPPGAFQAAQ
ncbi:MAG: cytochrome c peroxidase [Sulfuriferula sp.]|nr:cytochrome c peroxidase [Sulfuriferula sp.]